MKSEMLANKMNIDLAKLHSIDKTLKKQYDKPDVNVYKDKAGRTIREQSTPNGSKKRTIIDG